MEVTNGFNILVDRKKQFSNISVLLQDVSIDFFIAVQWNFKTNDERDPAQVIFTRVQVSVLKR